MLQLFAGISDELLSDLLKRLQVRAPGLKMISVITKEGFPVASTLKSSDKAILFAALIASIQNASERALQLLEDISELEGQFLQAKGSDKNFSIIEDKELGFLIITAGNKGVTLGLLEILSKMALRECVRAVKGIEEEMIIN